MHINMLFVTSNTGLPKINLSASWLPDVGFTPGALVQALPEPGGISFRLCDEYMMKYSELYKTTREKGGTLIIVSSKSKLEISGKCVRNAGLDIGDSLIALYDFGLIKARKLPGKARLILTDPDGLTGKLKIRLTGDWMAELGFVTNAVVTATATPGAVTFKLQENGIENYHTLVKHARENKGQVIQVHRDGYTRCLEVGGAFLDKTEFGVDDTFIAFYEHGLIHVNRLDFESFGFNKARGLSPHYID
jgi:hypothetical protein